MKKIIALGFLAALFGAGLLAHAQVPVQPFNIVVCSAAATCCAVPVPQITIVPPPPPGQQPSATTTAGAPPVLYGLHVSNQGAAAAYVQLFNSAATPAAAATPLGASSWSVGAASDRDVSIGEMMGWTFSNGVQACCSSTQGTFTAAGSCGFILEAR